jgi:hypothetical protein
MACERIGMPTCSNHFISDDAAHGNTLRGPVSRPFISTNTVPNCDANVDAFCTTHMGACVGTDRTTHSDGDVGTNTVSNCDANVDAHCTTHMGACVGTDRTAHSVGDVGTHSDTFVCAFNGDDHDADRLAFDNIALNRWRWRCWQQLQQQYSCGYCGARGVSLDRRWHLRCRGLSPRPARESKVAVPTCLEQPNV